MSSADQLPSADVLRTSLTALSLPVWGSREQMWERLKNGGEKKKPGPKPKAAKPKVRAARPSNRVRQ